MYFLKNHKLDDKFRNLAFAKRTADASKIPLDVLRSKTLVWPKPFPK